MADLLFLQPLRVYKRWPMPEDFTGLISSVPTLALAQLAGCLPGHRHDLVDGIAREYSLRELDARVARADLVLVNAHSSIGALNVEANLRRIKDKFPDKKVVLGGHHATLYDREWVARGADFVVRNEGEQTVSELVAALAAGGDGAAVAGLTWRDASGAARRNPDRELAPDLDRLPMPDWRILDPKLYGLPLPGRGWATCVETSRGCDHGCTFCAASRMWRNRQRYKSVERVLEELRLLRGLGFRKLWVVDDNWGGDPDRAARICEAVLREKLDLSWMCFTRADTVSRNPGLFALAARAGLRHALVGFESSLAKSLRGFAKGTDGSDYAATSAILRRNKIFIGGFFIVGCHGETRAQTAEVLAAAAELADYPIVSIFEPRRGTADFERIGRAEDLPSADMFYHNTTHALPSLREGLMRQYRAFYRGFLLHPRQLGQFAWGTPAQRSFYRFLFAGMARSLLNVTPAKLRRPWEMVLDIRD